MIADLLESAMLISFGLAWPASILKTWRSQSTAGKSVQFLFIVMAGYVFGLAAKFLRGDINYVAAFYALNLVLVAADTFLYFHYLRLEKARLGSPR